MIYVPHRAPEGQPSPPHCPGGAEDKGEAVNSVELSCKRQHRRGERHENDGMQATLSEPGDTRNSTSVTYADDGGDWGPSGRPSTKRDDIDSWNVFPRREGAAWVGRVVDEATQRK